MSRDLVDALRVLRIELGIANDRVAEAVGVNPRDLDVLDVVDREGPCTPTRLTHRTGVRAATLTGVLARLERDGWVVRDADPRDGRSARLATTDRVDELRRLYADGDSAVAALAGDLDADTHAAIVEFLTTTATAVRAAAARLDPRADAPRRHRGDGPGAARSYTPPDD